VLESRGSVANDDGAGVEADAPLDEVMRTHHNEGAVSRWMFRAARQSLELVATMNRTVSSESIAAKSRKPPNFTPTPSH
jgi:hypothetical protein